jgi:hypothetical protein
MDAAAVEIEGYPDYFVTRRGDVVSVKNGRYRPLKQSILNSGYTSVMLCKKGKTKRFTVHRLVAGTFVPNISRADTINHIDGNKRNNASTNLEWCSRSENSRHALRTGLWVPRSKNVGEKNSKAKLTSGAVVDIRKRAKLGQPNDEIADVYRINPRTVVDVVTRTTWRHVA